MSIRRVIVYLLLSLFFLILAGAGALAGAYFFTAASLPRVETLADYRPPIVTRVYSDDGKVVAEFARERRVVVPVEKLPRRLINAFVSAEDSKFFQHKGIDLISIGRAAAKNIMAGGIVQGGSTITQQVAKSMLLTPERKFSRKFKEAILAYRMEKQLSKDDILYLYLNQIYLGHGAYGIQAAAESYFAKDVQDLTLAECALLAGLPQAPSRYSPYKNFAKAKDRQRYVLKRMAEEGYITPAQARAAEAEKIAIRPRENRSFADASYFTEQVRRYLEQTYGEEALYTGGLKVYTTMNLQMQLAAQKAVRDNLRDHDRRHGYRGPLKTLSVQEEATFLAQQDASLNGAPLIPGRLLKGVLTGSSGSELQVRLGSFHGRIPLKSTSWAGRIKVVPRGQQARVNAGGGETRLPVGSVLLVRVEEAPQGGRILLSLEQEPEAQGALVAIDPGNGRVKALVGGYDFQQSQFNRAVQARRQPGSAIKPLIYAAALDKGYTPASVILDTPVVYTAKAADGSETAWAPRNSSGSFSGANSLRQALTYSNNIVTVKILENIGVGYATSYIRKLGIESPLGKDLTLALGSSTVTPMELATAYTVFASGGIRYTPIYITKIVDRDGRVLESIDAGDFRKGRSKDQKVIRQASERVISPETSYLITNLMESVVQEGTGQRARALGRPVAGKTGTTNDQRDAWFAGYIPQLVAVSWVGYDQERSLGRGESGGRAAAPAWVSFMQDAARQSSAKPFPVPDGIEFHAIDPATGLLAPEESLEASIEAFAPGTAPTRYVTEEQAPNAQDFFELDMEEEEAL